MEEPLIYREGVTAVLIALSDIVAALRDIRGGLFGEEEEEE